MKVREFLIAMLVLVSQDTLRVKVDLVTVGVRVTDSRGREVEGLNAESFSVFDDGAAQKIEFFSNEEQAIALGVVLDRSFSMAYNQKLDRAKDAARALVRGARDGSEYFYIVFDDKVQLAGDLTSERQRMESAIDQTSLGAGTSLYDAVIQALSISKRAQQPRQALVVISDGADQHSGHRLEELTSAVREAQMQIYTIGYFGPEEEKLFRAPGARVALNEYHVIDNPRVVLENLAKNSGGESYFPRNDQELDRAVEKIVKDLRTQYTLAFYPRSSEGANRYHQLRVTVRGGKYNVRARPGYSQ
jgi:Ca-activated chloride channel homolog